MTTLERVRTGMRIARAIAVAAVVPCLILSFVPQSDGAVRISAGSTPVLWKQARDVFAERGIRLRPKLNIGGGRIVIAHGFDTEGRAVLAVERYPSIENAQDRVKWLNANKLGAKVLVWRASNIVVVFAGERDGSLYRTVWDALEVLRRS